MEMQEYLENAMRSVRSSMTSVGTAAGDLDNLVRSYSRESAAPRIAETVTLLWELQDQLRGVERRISQEHGRARLDYLARVRETHNILRDEDTMNALAEGGVELPRNTHERRDV